jgi:hypothetical protein
MSIASWFKNLKQKTPSFSTADYHKEELKKAERLKPLDNGWAKKYHTEQLEKSLPKEVERLKRLLAEAYTERKTPTKQDVLTQLQKFSEACEAKAHQKLLGVSNESEVSKIITATWYNECGKLLYLLFDDLNVQMEYVEEKVKQYAEKGLDEEVKDD